MKKNPHIYQCNPSNQIIGQCDAFDFLLPSLPHAFHKSISIPIMALTHVHWAPTPLSMPIYEVKMKNVTACNQNYTLKTFGL
jgi:hypothetical protein